MLRLGLSGAPRSRRSLFALTPLIDVMFLLLIFFMLSSQIAPFSLLPVSATTSGNAAERPAPDASPAGRVAVVRVLRGGITLDGEPVDLSALEPAFARRVAAHGGSFLVLPTRSATVQDLVTVLEALKAASAHDVALIGAAGASP